MTWKLVALAGLFSLTLAAQKVTLEFDEEQDFSDYKTFALINGKINSKNPALNNDLTVKKLEGIIRKRLTERGLTEVQSRADLNLIYSLGSDRRKQVEHFGRGWRGSRTLVYHFTEGTLVLKLRDAKKDQLVWQSIAVENKDDPAKIQSSLDDVVRKSFEKYPPKKK